MGCTVSRSDTHRQLGSFAVSKLSKSIEHATVNNNGRVAICVAVAISDKHSCHSGSSSRKNAKLPAGQKSPASNRTRESRPKSRVLARGPKTSLTNSSSFKSIVKRKGHPRLEAQGEHDNQKTSQFQFHNSSTSGSNDAQTISNKVVFCQVMKQVQQNKRQERESHREMEHQQGKEDSFEVESRTREANGGSSTDSSSNELHSQTTYNTNISSQSSIRLKYEEITKVKTPVDPCAVDNGENKTSSFQHCSDTCVSYYVCDPNCNEASEMQTIAATGDTFVSLVEYCSCKIQGSSMNCIAPDQAAVVLHKDFLKDFGDDYDDEDFSEGQGAD